MLCKGARSSFTFFVLPESRQNLFFLLLVFTRDFSQGLERAPGRWFGHKLQFKPGDKEMTPA